MRTELIGFLNLYRTVRIISKFKVVVQERGLGTAHYSRVRGAAAEMSIHHPNFG